MDENSRHEVRSEDRNDDRKRDASNNWSQDREAVNRRQVEQDQVRTGLTQREREERWPIG
jgi:hypothetical protein